MTLAGDSSCFRKRFGVRAPRPARATVRLIVMSPNRAGRLNLRRIYLHNDTGSMHKRCISPLRHVRGRCNSDGRSGTRAAPQRPASPAHPGSATRKPPPSPTSGHSDRITIRHGLALAGRTFCTAYPRSGPALCAYDATRSAEPTTRNGRQSRIGRLPVTGTAAARGVPTHGRGRSLRPAP